MKTLLPQFFSLLIVFSSFAQPEWNLKIDKGGIKVYNLKNDTSKTNELKVVTTFNTTATSLLKIIMDIEHHPDWVYGTKLSYALKKVSDTELYFYKEVRSPAPISNRDLVAHLNVVRNATDQSISIQVSAVPTYLPEKKSLVRVPYFNELWNIKPSKDQVRVEYYLRIDPGGSIPSSLVNLFATKGPYESFVNLKELIDEKSGK
jgi:hypothetical protein